jgi:hypothetical protein
MFVEEGLNVDSVTAWHALLPINHALLQTYLQARPAKVARAIGRVY